MMIGPYNKGDLILRFGAKAVSEIEKELNKGWLIGRDVAIIKLGLDRVEEVDNEIVDMMVAEMQEKLDTEYSAIKNLDVPTLKKIQEGNSKSGVDYPKLISKRKEYEWFIAQCEDEYQDWLKTLTN